MRRKEIRCGALGRHDTRCVEQAWLAWVVLCKIDESQALRPADRPEQFAPGLVRVQQPGGEMLYLLVGRAAFGEFH